MGDKSSIEWTDATWNPIAGCSLVSPGCTNCYAMKQAQRIQHMTGTESHYFGTTRVVNGHTVWTGQVNVAPDSLFLAPLKWKKPRRIFVNSMSDLFHEAVPFEVIDRVFAIMALCPQHTFQVLTKRPERMRTYLQSMHDCFHGNVELFGARWGSAAVEVTASPCAAGAVEDRPFPLPNVWLGVSVEDQPRADERIPILLDTPAALHWISAEPLMSGLDLRAWVPDAWKIKQPVRTWENFVWPDWVPAEVRKEIESFWNPEWNRGPNAWMRGAHENGQPPLGTRGTYSRFRPLEPGVEGRFIPTWNNIGRVIADDGSVHCVSAGIYQSRPTRLGWVVAGGESGAGARPMHPDWVRSLRDQCSAASVPFLFKQWGGFTVHTIGEDGSVTPPIDRIVSGYHGYRWQNGAFRQIGLQIHSREFSSPGVVAFPAPKKVAGRLLDGRVWDQYPGTPAREVD